MCDNMVPTLENTVIVGNMLKQSKPKEATHFIMKDRQGVDPRVTKENCKYLKWKGS